MTIHSLLAYLYPAFCLQCRMPLQSEQKVCDICAHELEPLDPLERCPLCFSLKPSCTTPCQRCRTKPPHHRIFGQACVLHESSLTQQLLRYLSRRIDSQLEQAMASMAYLYIDQLHWPTPDYLLLEPDHWLLPKRAERALSQRLAKQLARLLHIPCLRVRVNPLSMSNPYLSLEEQTGKEVAEISLFPPETLHGKNILLFTTELLTGNTWNTCAQGLEWHGLSRLRTLGLIASTRSWMN